jgi:hypothetical protein
MELEDFFSAQNIARYRRLLDRATGEIERRAIIELLAEEHAKLKGGHRLYASGMSSGARRATPSRHPLST